MKKIVNDFIWLVVTDKAKEIFNADLFQLYTLHDDGSEALIETFEDLNVALGNGLDIGIEVGRIATQDAKVALEFKGYYTENLWHINDVRTQDETLTDDQCMEVLNDVMASPYIIETINQQIEYTLNENL
jgi:hypothetical protein